ncbi:hypothetical protein V6N13_042682 [Hibiscus sabdariffa]|uniref:Uncharacterized protein n=1 Tax=Hibiscus sabdariffa TaxID=183260 RepID=A0ABR2G3U9_9ROSI
MQIPEKRQLRSAKETRIIYANKQEKQVLRICQVEDEDPSGRELGKQNPNQHNKISAEDTTETTATNENVEDVCHTAESNVAPSKQVGRPRKRPFKKALLVR